MVTQDQRETLAQLAESSNEKLVKAGAGSAEQSFGLGCALVAVPLGIGVLILYIFGALNLIMGIICLVGGILGLIGVVTIITSQARARGIALAYTKEVEREITAALEQAGTSSQEFALDMTVSAQVDTIDVAKATTFAGSPGVMTGRLGGTIDVRAAAGAPDVVFRTATGRATLAVADGTFPGLDLIGPVILAFGKPDTAKTVERSSAFATLGGTFALSRGVLQSDDFSMASRDLDLKGREMRVAGSVVDVKADLLLSEALSSQAGRDLQKYAHEGSRVVLPATITGSLASPKVSIDLGAAAGRAIRNAAEDEVKKGLGRLRKH